jgi:AsmA protein
MKSTLSRIVFKVLRIGGIATGSIVLLLFLLPYLFPGFVSNKIRQWARSNIRTELNFSLARLSFFRHFPALTLTLYDVKLNGSAPFEKETLVKADEIALGVDWRSIFSELDVDKVFLTNAFINIQADSAGHANYNIYVSPKGGPAVAADSTGVSLKIRKILIEKSRLFYNDRSLPILVNARDIDYEGNGDLSQAIFDLHTHMEIASMDLYYNHQAYFVSKKINADLVTKINTNSLAFSFEKNDLLINRLPVSFIGRFAFLNSGYDMDFKLRSASNESDLHDIFTALPPGMLDWLSKTEVKGSGYIDAALTGKYIAARNIMPDLMLNLKVRNGYIFNAQASSPVKNLYLDFRSRLPGLNLDSLNATVDSIYFNIDRDYFGAVLQLKGVKQPWISARVNTGIDLEKWDRAFGVGSIDVKGRYDLHLQAEGKYATSMIHRTGIRTEKTDTIVTSIPRFTLTSSLRNGYFKYDSRPAAVEHISFDLGASCRDNNYKHIRLSVDNFNFNVLSSYVKGFIRLANAGDHSVEAGLESVLHLSDIKKVIPLDSTHLSGDLAVHVRTKGNYQPSSNQFPTTMADLQLNNGVIQTRYYPAPLEKIQVSARVTNKGSSLKDLEVAITSVSFRFEGHPFTMKADLHNFRDLKYNIVSAGMLDLGKVSRVFALQGYDVKGSVETRFSLRGRQSDATAGRYDLLMNKGTIKIKDLQVSSELFPLPFRIQTGLFRFDQDRMWFDSFRASYGKSQVVLTGWLSNMIAYLTDRKQPLKGRFDLKSDEIVADQFMAFAGGGPPTASPAPFPASSPPTTRTGVFIVPGDLSIRFNALVKRVRYNGLKIDRFKGGVTIDSGSLFLDTTRFALAGAPVEMNAVYKSLSPQKARFDYHIQAKQFDVQRAYREIKLFRDLATSASKAQGIVSLDYRLAGLLDGNMHAVYPSLKGGGILSISKVKVKGLRLFSAVSRETNKNVTDPDLSKVEIKTTIDHNILTLERTRMKVSVFRLRMEGQAGFDGRLNLRFRVGLPPFGLIGIPLTITGTQENPRIKTGRGSKNDELQDSGDKEEESLNNIFR